MVKLDVSLLRYLDQEDFKILTSVEMGSKNHELVPGALINSIASLKFGGTGKVLVELTKNKLLAYERGKRYDGYRLTYAGYDYLALNALVRRDTITGVGNQIGVGKESDVYNCLSSNDELFAIKFHRLGRVCFRRVSEKRDFYTKSRNKTSWLYLSRKAAQREYQFLSYMYHKGFPVPKPIDSNRHVVVMELVDGHLLNHYNSESFEEEDRLDKIEKLYTNLMNLILRFANEARVVHGDFNEFNILIKKDELNNELQPVIIDLPQMIEVTYELAPEYFDRDVTCIVDFFFKRFGFTSNFIPSWDEVLEYKQEENHPSQLSLFLKDTLEIQDGDVEELEFENQFSKDDVLATPKQFGTEIDKEVSISSAHDHVDECASLLTTVTIDPMDARKRLQSELMRREMNRRRREAAKSKNIKGDANPVRRRRKIDKYVACEDASNFNDIF